MDARQQAQLDQSEQPVQPVDPEDDYNEDEDEDYVVEDAQAGDVKSAGNGDSNGKDSDDEDDYVDEEEDKQELAKYSKIESSTGGLVKTRKQRQEEELQQKQQRKKTSLASTSSNGSSSVNIDSIWAELNSSGSSGSKNKGEDSGDSELANGSNPTISEPVANKPVSIAAPLKAEKIKITSTYEFAGKTITEEKWVEADSQEAKAYLNSAKLTSKLESEEKQGNTPDTSKTQPQKPLLRRKRKRESLLDAVISNSSKTKLSTLEKSRLDWATYVDRNKINDELKYKNKSGFLEKQDFLNRVESRRDDLYKNAKSNSKSQN